MKGTSSLLGGAALGALAMFLLDPDDGKRRRSMLRDKAVRLGNVKRDALNKAVQDLGNRWQGVRAEAVSKVSHETHSDHVLCERVRSKIGRAVTHTKAIQVDASSGVVTLRGQILADELDAAVKMAESVKGVQQVLNELEVHTSPDVPALQGDARLPAASHHLKPATAMMSGVAGAALALYGVSRKDAVGAAIGAAGVALAGKGFMELEGNRLLGIEHEV